MSPRVLLSRLLEPLLRTRRDRRLAEEVRMHLELLAEDFEAQGLSHDEARRAARRAFGGIDQVRMHHRELRGFAPVDALTQDLRFATRVLTRDKGFAVTTILVLALGIGVNNMMFTILYSHTLRSLPTPEADRVVYVSSRDGRGTDRGLSRQEFDDLREAVRSAELAAFVSGPAAFASLGHVAERVERTYVTGNTFDVLQLPVAMGRVLSAADDHPGAAPVALITETLWKSTFHAAATVLGHEVMIDGAPSRIVGVVADRAGFPGNTAVWQPLSARGPNSLPPGERSLRVIGRARVGQTVADAAAEIHAVGDRMRSNRPQNDARITLHVVTLNERYLGRVTDPTWAAFMTVGFLVFVIATANAAHLMMARGVQRAREIAIRVSLGASRARVFRQLLLESAVLAGIGALLGLLVAVAGARLFLNSIPHGTLPYWIDYSVDARVLGALVAIGVAAAVLAGSAPAWHACRAEPNDALRSGGAAAAFSRAGRTWSGAFLIGELALTVVMLANVGLSMRLSAPLATDHALTATDVLTGLISLPVASYADAHARARVLERVQDELASVPGVRAVALASFRPVFPAPEQQVTGEAQDREAAVTARMVAITPQYFSVLRLGVERGRMFTIEDVAVGRAPVIVNAHLASRLFAAGDAIGRRVAIVPPVEARQLEWGTIVGVAPDIRQRPQAGAESIIYVPFRAESAGPVALLMATGPNTEQAATAAREALRRVEPFAPLYDVATLDQAVAQAEWNPRLSNRLALTLTGLAVALAMAGLFAVISRLVSARQREFAVRRALGATLANVGALVLRRAAGYVAWGAFGGALASLVWDAGFGVSARSQATLPGAHLVDARVLLPVAAVMAMVAVAASVVPVWRATSVDPTTVLKES